MRVLLLCCFTIIQTSFAGGFRVGNGGDVVVCNSDVKLLDRYEAEDEGLEILINGNHLGEKVEYIMGNLRKVAPRLYRKISAEVYALLADFEAYELSGANFLNMIEMKFSPLRDVKDSIAVLPKHCRLEQLVVQQPGSRVSGDRTKEYLVNGFLWERLSLEDKAMTIFHEAIYKRTRVNGEGNSYFARKIVGYISSTKMLLGKDAYNYFVRRLYARAFRKM